MTPDDLRAWRLLAGAGAALLALDKRFGADAPDEGLACAGGVCPNYYRTNVPGIALLAGGGAALVGATVLLVMDARKRRPELRLSLAMPSLRAAR